MRPVFVAWLIRHGWPAWFCPDYATMVGFSTLLGALLVLRQAERDRANITTQARALIFAYLGALIGGYLFEWIRAIPVAIHQHSFAPIAFAGRAAYGGLIFGALAPVLYLRRHAKHDYEESQPVLAFLDRATIGMGIVFACVRFGCFLEGCDFGQTTASWLGVRFPAGSPAADAHALAGFIPSGAESLPVHPTELYESCVGILATLLALVPLRKGGWIRARGRAAGASPLAQMGSEPANERRDGAAFATWLMTYAIGRFLLEQLRGDVERGHYASLSTAQWVSVVIVIGVLFAIGRGYWQRSRRSEGSSSVIAVASMMLAVASLFTANVVQAADEPQPLPSLPPTTAPSSSPPPAATTGAAPAVATPAPAAAPQATTAPSGASAGGAEVKEPNGGGDEASKKVVTLRVALVSALTLARPDVPSGWAAEIDVLYRLRLGRRSRLDIGVEGRRFENAEAIHTSIGVASELVIEGGRHFEVLFTFVPHHTWFDFKSGYFTNTNAYGLRYGIGAQFPIGPVELGVTPLSFTTTSSTTVGVISQWEPRIWAGVSF